MNTIDILNKYGGGVSDTWRSEAEYRRENSRWLKYSLLIALRVRSKMAESGLTQKVLAERLGCTQQHVSMILKGTSNLTLETISKLEDAVGVDIMKSSVDLVTGYSAESSCGAGYLSEHESPEYGNND